MGIARATFTYYKEVCSMAQAKRKDRSRAILRKGEVQRQNGTYHYCWTDGIKVEARYTTINELFDLWRQLKRGLKDNTFGNYRYMYDTYVRP